MYRHDYKSNEFNQDTIFSSKYIIEHLRYYANFKVKKFESLFYKIVLDCRQSRYSQ